MNNFSNEELLNLTNQIGEMKTKTKELRKLFLILCVEQEQRGIISTDTLVREVLLKRRK